MPVENKKMSMLMAMLVLFIGAYIANGGSEKTDFRHFDRDSHLEDLSPPVRCFFDAAARNDSEALITCFSDEVTVNIAGMQFKGPEETAAFAERNIWGGKYKVEKVFKQQDKEIVHCLFWPKGWPSPEPPIEYQFQVKDAKIIDWYGKYR
jgi:hypothetical protein